MPSVTRSDDSSSLASSQLASTVPLCRTSWTFLPSPSSGRSGTRATVLELGSQRHLPRLVPHRTSASSLLAAGVAHALISGVGTEGTERPVRPQSSPSLKSSEPSSSPSSRDGGGGAGGGRKATRDDSRQTPATSPAPRKPGEESAAAKAGEGRRKGSVLARSGRARNAPTRVILRRPGGYYAGG
ncbi:hypothetical protein ACHAWF_011066 [Thalassiosira exigua]